MRVADNTELEGKALFDYLVENEKSIAETKMSSVIKSMPLIVDSRSDFFEKGIESVKIKTHHGKAEETEDPNGVNVKVVANVCGWMDHDQDVLIAGAYDETVMNDKMYHLHDHIHKIIARVGIVKKVTIENISFSELGVSGVMGNTQALIFYTEIRKELNESVFWQYKLKAVDQHSIGLRYQEIRMAINSADYPVQYETWQQYIGDVINREDAEQRGYFWAVTKVKVYENSAVLFGSNELTPTLSTEETKSDTSSEEEVENKDSETEKEQEQEEESTNHKLLL